MSKEDKTYVYMIIGIAYIYTALLVFLAVTF
jgi:hypothetical protein